MQIIESLQHALQQLQVRERVGLLAISHNGFVFDPMSGQSFSLNGSGLSLLRHLQQTADASQLLNNLTAEFEVDEAQAALAATRFIGQLDKVLS